MPNPTNTVPDGFTQEDGVPNGTATFEALHSKTNTGATNQSTQILFVCDKSSW
jgi:hypothetical protein